MENPVQKLTAAIVMTCCTVSALAESQPPTHLVTSNYANPSDFCFYPGEWNGDLSAASMKYRLIIAPENQQKFGDLYVGFRRSSDPNSLWLYGYTVNPSTGFGTPSDWVQFDAAKVPPTYAMNQSLQPVMSVNAFPAPMDLRRFDGDGEVLVGYGMRSEGSNSSPRDSFKDMVDNRRYAAVFKIDKAQPLLFGNYTCVRFTELTQRVPGLAAVKAQR